ncbi:hypothetical protein N8892_00380 [Candidatus Pelagibacter sp.]|nr:hypothetical protein [Candidatus Pelagibacter sp.]
MKRLLAYLFIVLGLGLTFNVNAKANNYCIPKKVEYVFQSIYIFKECYIYHKKVDLETFVEFALTHPLQTVGVDKESPLFMEENLKWLKKYLKENNISNSKINKSIKRVKIAKAEPSQTQKVESINIEEKKIVEIKKINKEKKISYNFKSNTCEPFESKVSFQNIICISKDDVEDLYNGYKLSPFQSFKKDTYDNGKYIQSSILLDMYPEQMKLIVNKGCASWSCTKKKAGQNVYKMFVQRTERWHSKYPGDIIKAMSWFEILYLGKLNKSEKIIKRYLNSSTDDYFKAKLDKKELKSLIKMNKGRLQMRKAIGLKRDDELSKVFETQWALGIYLNKDKRKVKKNIVDPALKKRRVLLMSYKSALKKYKEKVAEIK